MKLTRFTTYIDERYQVKLKVVAAENTVAIADIVNGLVGGFLDGSIKLDLEEIKADKKRGVK